jgi:S1-C subfamily serine protease
MKALLSSVRLSQILLLIIIVLTTISLALHFFSSSAPADTRSAVVMVLDEGGIIGTGTLIDDQTVLTSKHFLVEGELYGVRFSDSSLASVVSLTLHPSLDLALLRLDSSRNLRYPRISSQKPSLQTPVIAFGTSQNTTITEHRGVVLSQDERVEIGGDLFTGLLLTDISFQSGYSGGPLMNMRGEIIGVHTAYESSGKSGWSTPVTREILEVLKSLSHSSER